MLTAMIIPPKRHRKQDTTSRQHSRRTILARLRQDVAILRTLGVNYDAIALMLGIDEEDARDLSKHHRLDKPSLKLTRRAINALIHGRHAARGGKTLADRARRLTQIALAYTPEELLREPGIGQVTVMEIELWLEERGLSLRDWDNFKPYAETVRS